MGLGGVEMIIAAVVSLTLLGTVFGLLLGTAATHGVNPVLYANSGVDPVRDFAAVGTAADMANVLSVNPKRLDVKSVAELVAEGKRRNLVYGSVGNGSSSHLAMELLKTQAGLFIVHMLELFELYWAHPVTHGLQLPIKQVAQQTSGIQQPALLPIGISHINIIGDLTGKLLRLQRQFRKFPL